METTYSKSIANFIFNARTIELQVLWHLTYFYYKKVGKNVLSLVYSSFPPFDVVLYKINSFYLHITISREYFNQCVSNLPKMPF